MSETAVRPAQDEMTIDLRQMGYFVLKKWKILLIFIIVGLLLGTGLTLLKGETTLESFDTTKMDNDASSSMPCTISSIWTASNMTVAP